MTLDEVLSHLASHGGLLGMSEISGDIRDLEQAAMTKHTSSACPGCFVQEIQRQLGGMLVAISGRTRSSSPAELVKREVAFVLLSVKAWKNLEFTLMRRQTKQ